MPEDRSIEIIQAEEQIGKRYFKMNSVLWTCEQYLKSNIGWVLEVEERKWNRKIFKEIIAENMSYLKSYN